MDRAKATVIVALPSVDDKVYKISSEKVPHLTLCFLGENATPEDLINVTTFVQHAASELSPFGLTVDYRDVLGPDEADVLFFDKKDWSFPRISSFRHHLLLNDTIAKLYDSADQYPEWTPHLTLGYPETPAKEDDSDYPGIGYVHFDRIAVWMGDSEGPEFRLKYDDYGPMEVAMSGMSAVESGQLAASELFHSTAVAGAQAIGELFHYGKKGMRWGVTTVDKASGKTPKPPTEVELTQKKQGTYTKSKGGENLPVHDDAKPALVARQKAKKSTTDALSDAELKTAIRRMQLEQQFQQLDYSVDRRSNGKRFIDGLFGNSRPKKPVDLHEKQGEQLREQVAPIVKKKVSERLGT